MNMDTNNFILNDIFKENAKVYQTKPVRATKYQPGMETGWVVYMQNEPNMIWKTIYMRA